jgi:prepilin peptidase CpaA
MTDIGGPCMRRVAVSTLPLFMIPLALYLTTLVVGMTTDVRSRRVPNVLVLVMLTWSMGAALAQWSPAGSLVGAGFGAGVGLALWLPFWFLGLLGAGDVKFFAAGSAWIGAPLAWRAACAAALLGGGMAIVVLLVQRGLRRTATDVLLQYQQAAHIIASADVSAGEARARTFPYAVPMGIALATAAIRPSLFLSW